jgi:hypothetical protein
MGIREEAESDLAEILEDTDGAGTPYILVDKEGVEYPVCGTYGDIGYKISPDTGIPVLGRTITATYRIRTLREQTEKTPEQGWKVKANDLYGNEQILFVTKFEADKTIGIGRLKLGIK